MRKLDEAGAARTLSMQRGVSQLLFNYTPGRAVDWEDGIAIVVLGGVSLRDVWQDERSTAVLREVADFRRRWIERGGEFDQFFPDPMFNASAFAVGTPVSIAATYLRAALVCQKCQRLVFLDKNLTSARVCPSCGSRALRQFPHVLVHGCGEMVPVGEWIPATKAGAEQRIEITKYPLKCKTCGPEGDVRLAAKSERAKDLKVICRKCETVAVDRIIARCHRCVEEIARKGQQADANTLIGRVTMRLARYSASDAYYPISLSMLRLDRQRLSELSDDLLVSLRHLMPQAAADAIGDVPAQIELLARRAALFPVEFEANMARIRELSARAPGGKQQVMTTASTVLQEDLRRSLAECVAFRTSVTVQPLRLLDDGTRDASDAVLKTMSLQGLREVSYVGDLPVIAATFGYTRRWFEPTYDETFAKQLPVRVRPFDSLSKEAAAMVGRPEIVGRVPILAREGEHEGLFVALDIARVVRWLEANGVDLPPGATDAERIVIALEPVDKFYDSIWTLPVRRLVFGLLHSMSHLAMKAVSRFAGVERTSLSEYILLPLLGFVVYDSSSSFKLGGIESLAKEHLHSFLTAMEIDETSCLYDPDCIDRLGACHGCIHSPEIACRVFNHGLSRAFVLGGHAPWKDSMTDVTVQGFWDADLV